MDAPWEKAEACVAANTCITRRSCLLFLTTGLGDPLYLRKSAVSGGEYKASQP